MPARKPRISLFPRYFEPLDYAVGLSMFSFTLALELTAENLPVTQETKLGTSVHLQIDGISIQNSHFPEFYKTLSPEPSAFPISLGKAGKTTSSNPSCFSHFSSTEPDS